jgi:hypothetical protein
LLFEVGWGKGNPAFRRRCADQETTVFALYRTADGSTGLQATKIVISQRMLQSVLADFARRVAQRDLDYGVAARKLYDQALVSSVLLGTVCGRRRGTRCGARSEARNKPHGTARC